MKYWHIVPICFFIILHIAYYFKYILNREFAKDIVCVSMYIIIALLLINIVPAIPKIIEKNKKIKNNYDIAAQQIVGGQHNIYWMVFDECASFPVIEKYYGETNVEIQQFLRDEGFSVSNTSYNECTHTRIVLTNCFNLDYVVDSSMDNVQTSKYLKNSPLINLVEGNGYKIRGIGDTEWLGIKSVNNEIEEVSQTIEGIGSNELILRNTIVGPFIRYDGNKSAKLILDTFEYMENERNFIPDDSQFNMLYINCPHQPFLFDENGVAPLSA